MRTLIISLMLFSCTCFSQVSSFYVKSVNLDSRYDADEDSSFIIVNKQEALNRLLFFIGGTGSSPDSYNGFLNHMGNEGFHVISISYLNDVAAASLKNDTDSKAFTNYRQEICFGTPLSDNVDVDSLNSIFMRATKLIAYLNTNYPNDDWGQFLTATNNVDWSKISISGHSQGAGHAAYMAQFDAMERVAMFAGPNDYSDYFSAAGEWLMNNGETPLNRYFSYLSLNDEVVSYSKQYENMKALDLFLLGDSILVDVNVSPYENSHALYTSQSKGFSLLHHNTPVKNSLLNRNVWKYIFKSEILGLEDKNTSLAVYPNPSMDGLIFVNFGSDNEDFVIVDLTGKRLLNGRATASHEILDLSELKAGIYILSTKDYSARIILTK